MSERIDTVPGVTATVLPARSEEILAALSGHLEAGCGVVFLPGDPPRQGNFVLYTAHPSDFATSFSEMLQVVLPTRSGNGARRRSVPARRFSVVEAIDLLPRLAQVPGATEWSAAVLAGLGLIARGRLFPTVTAQGWDGWSTGPLDPADRRLLDQLAEALPACGHALALRSGSPLRLRSPRPLISAMWDALADTLVRTAAAPALAERTPPSARAPRNGDRPVAFASSAPVTAEHLRGWLVEAAEGLAGDAGADVALRVELDPFVDVEHDDGSDNRRTRSRHQLGRAERVGRAVLQLTSRAESSLVVDANDLYSSPAAVLARLGGDAEADLVRALRRAARAWPPLEALLRERAPTGLDLNEERLSDLFGDAADRLRSAAVEVLWPAEFVSGGIELRAAVTTAPGVVTQAGLGLSDLVEFRWQATLHGELLSEDEVEHLAEAKRGLVRLRGRWVVADPGLLDRIRSRRNRRLALVEALSAVLSGTVEVDGTPVPVVAEGPVAELALRLDRLSAEPVPLDPPSDLAPNVELRPYQARGVAWLYAMAEAGLGACLADDMGLGKTLQVIAVHLHRAAAGRGPTLVVCPTSLLANWEREVRRFAPHIPVRRHHGGARRLGAVAPGEIVLTSYGVARRDAAMLAEAGFALVVADEAQHAKNPQTATARALRVIGGPVRMALTGTPVENRLSDLWSILDWTTPGLLGPFERFLRTVARPIERDRDAEAIERFARTIRPFVLRRHKSDPGVAPDLPARTVTDVAVPLTQEQVTLYEAEVREALAAIEQERGITRQGLVLRLLTVLKQICNHPAQYLHQHGPLPGRSGKLAALEELVDVIVAENESVLVFSQFVECLSLLETRLGQLGIGTLSLHGGVPARRRSELVDAFQAGRSPVLLLSLKVGGVGLNLTRATHVVHYDRWWNPAVEDQATDRAHRIGQDRPVQVHRLIAEGTLEDRIGQVIERKRALAEAIVGTGESWIGRLSNDELADLVRLGGVE